MDLHQPETKPEKSGSKVDQPRTTCGKLNVHSYQQLEAVKWAVEVINNRSWPEEFAIGTVFHFLHHFLLVLMERLFKFTNYGQCRAVLLFKTESCIVLKSFLRYNE